MSSERQPTPIVTRRKALGAIAVGALAPTAYFTRSATAKNSEKESEVDCTEGVELSEQSKRMRETLQYIPRTKYEDKYCSNCLQWIEPEGEGPCGGCKLFSGPVHARGYCNSYAPAKKS